MMYPARVVRGAGREVRHILAADTPTHGALRDRLAGIALITIVLDLIFAGLALLFEHGEAQTQLHTYGDALFWCTTQLLTVSSQIQNPFSTGGRILDVVIEAYAMVVVASVTGSMGAFLVRRAHEAEAAKARQSGVGGAPAH
jgi:voltage-gated potassium channel